MIRDRKKSILILLILCLNTVNGWAEPLVLKKIVEEALQNNPEIKAAKGRWEAAKALAPQTRSLEDPVLSVMFDKVPDSNLNPGDSMERVYSITQEFPYPGKLGLMNDMAEKEAGMAYESYREKERGIVREVKAAFFDWFMVIKSIEINKETRDILLQISKTAEARYATGLVSQWDVLKAQMELSQLANEIIILNQERESATARINRLLNRPLEGPLGEPELVNADKSAPSFDVLEKMAIADRPELKGMERAIDREDAGLNLAKRGYYPDFMMRLGRVEAKDSEDGWLAEFGVRVPLWFRSKQDNAVAESVSRLDAARNDYKGMKNMVSYEIKDALVRINTAKVLVELHRSTHIPQAEQALKGAQAGYETGKVDFVPVMESWKTLKNYRLEYYRAQVAYEQAWADLEKAVGKELP